MLEFIIVEKGVPSLDVETLLRLEGFSLPPEVEIHTFDFNTTLRCMYNRVGVPQPTVEQLPIIMFVHENGRTECEFTVSTWDMMEFIKERVPSAESIDLEKIETEVRACYWLFELVAKGEYHPELLTHLGRIYKLIKPVFRTKGVPAP